MSDGQAPREKILELVQTALDHRAREVRDRMERGLPDLLAEAMEPLREPLDREIEKELQRAAGTGARGPDLAGLREAVEELAATADQVSLLNALVGGAMRFASRSALFVVRQGQACGWTAGGYPPDGTVGDIRHSSLPLDQDSPVAGAVREGRVVVAEGTEEARRVSTALQAPAPERCAALPLALGERVVGVLYADAGEAGGTGSLDLDALEILVRFAAARLAGLRGAARPAGRVPAAPVERRPSQAWASPRVETGSMDLGRGGADVEAPPAVAEEVEPSPEPAEEGAARPGGDAHEEARRFARLLVSEILLYNEARVEEGRRNADLCSRLHEDLERSEQMYRQRADAAVVESTDYFREEVLRTLANGDPSLLGSG